MAIADIKLRLTVKKRPIAARICWGIAYSVCYMAAPLLSQGNSERLAKTMAGFVQKCGYKIEVHKHG